MPSLITDEIKAKAIIYRGKEICKEQTQRLLREAGLPNGLLPIEEAEECGYIEETGFVWLKQKNKLLHKFEKIGRQVTYGTEVTAYAVPTKITKLTGVKAKELMMWISLTEISVPHMNADKVTFKASAAGITRTFPAEAFMVAEDPKEKEKEKEATVDQVVKEKETKEAEDQVLKQQAENVKVKLAKDENVVLKAAMEVND